MQAFNHNKNRITLDIFYDNGYGISPAIENMLFEPFVTTKPKGEGRGLGLFIIQQLLDSSKCTIALEPFRNEHGRKYIFAINFSNIINEYKWTKS